MVVVKDSLKNKDLLVIPPLSFHPLSANVLTIVEPVSYEITEEDNFFESTDSIFDIPEEENSVEETFAEEGPVEESTVEETFVEESPVEETASEEVEKEEITEESPLEESNFDEIITDEPVVEETVVEESSTEDEAFGTTDDIFDIDFDNQEVTADDTVSEEAPIVEETAVTDEEVMADTPEESVEDDFVSVDQNINNLSASNIDYLTTKENNVEEDDENAELKKDIKSVLLYMDQLLENLPEDKIVEFAKSEEFATYKKLFSELGLS